ncbi:MAG: hypothetical protein A2X11_04655 [Bacteroidetes bacterium GWE2_42_24]|nr:MAG: hypothetical protein A2X11_04655 [Bacteroidetes bacterium GWE2_42_24]
MFVLITLGIWIDEPFFMRRGLLFCKDIIAVHFAICYDLHEIFGYLSDVQIIFFVECEGSRRL